MIKIDVLVDCPFESVGDCEVCNGRENFSTIRSIEESMRLLEIYRAMASPAFIFNTTDDPILEAFKLSVEMDNMERVDPAFKVR